MFAKQMMNPPGRRGLRGASARALLVLAACAMCASSCGPSTPDLVIYETTRCQLLSAPTFREGTPAWVGCRVAIERGAVEQLLIQLVTPGSTGSFWDAGDEWLVVRLNRHSPATGRVRFGRGDEVQPPVGEVRLRFYSPRLDVFYTDAAGEGELTTNVATFDPSDYCRAVVVDGSATSSLSGLTIRAGERVGGQFSRLFTCGVSSRASWVYRCAATTDPASCTAVP